MANVGVRSSMDRGRTWLKEKSPWAYKVLSFIKAQMISYWFFEALAIFVALAYKYPSFARHGGTIRGEYSIGYGAVAVIFLGSGLSMSTKSLMKNMGHWRAHLVVLVLQFLITPAILYGFACAIRAAHNAVISDWMLVGLIVTACCPTTVASNVVMTKQADGNDLLTLCEVFIGNVLGAVITPALVQLFTTGEWSFANPANGSSVTRVYKDVFKQIGLSVFIPLFVGQVLQNLFPKPVKIFYTKTKFNKVGSFMLVLIMWSSFSTAFYQHAFTAVSHQSIIMICFFNVGIYVFFTVICFLISRPIFLLKVFKEEPDRVKHSTAYIWSYHLFRPFYYNRRDTVAIALCGAAKTAALGVSLVTAQYGDNSPHLGQLLVPLVLYQSEQVLTAGILTKFMKKWIHAGPEYKQELELKLKAKDEEEAVPVQEEVDEGSDEVFAREEKGAVEKLRDT
ncbi:unnamed protein product [Kuraishia capsulata CBS 1993]|uniref:Uncharacterized protein n=1 Tax=Kuraishia capsulata CBS 1993 TaxID=1382522 RepID=W6MV18_9ASCO|nr:uncharacterized protein KUCA_T00005715001 [Kuraishia capsulata CBS 1993]CDK29722.1 unnamed protein product [Kuraishia capsulata CBS 1993]